MDTPITDAFGHVAADELAAQGRYQRDLADALGVTQATVSRRLGGQFSLDLADAERIAQFLNVPLADLIARAS